MYPSHEAQTRPQSPSTVDTSPDRAPRASGITVDSVCERLGISRPIYDLLMGSYFDNMTAFSLFRPGSIEPKFAMMQYHSDAEALIAAMFSFSARHARDVSDTDIPSPAYFAQIASSKLDESVDRYGDLRPPFWLLQAGILVTFYQLTRSVRSRSWKKLGDCIRYAYDTNLHLVDANVNPDQEEHPDLDKWVLMEERRRAWWAVWEMDVFASTIRRLPTAIDPSLNLTKLPVSDACWFKRTYQPSCFLVEDCGARWKALARSGNQCAKAWFIVINSLMRNTQRLVYPAGSHQSLGTTNHDELSIMANCLYCTVTSLPSGLAYQGETLTFRGGFRADGTSPRQAHADLYSIHLMTQLCRFMIYHHKICARAPWLSRQKDKAPPQLSGEATSEWSNYISASDEIVSIVRSSARDHFRFVNPFLANTLWFAAAAQCACRVFGPPSFNKRLTGSNLDLLRLTIDRFIAFWDGMGNLGGKLARIETGLQNLMNKPGSDIRGNGDSLPTDLGHLPEQSTAAVPQPQTDAVPDGHGPAVQLSTAWPAPFIPEFQVGDVSTQTFALPGGGHGHDFFAAPLDFSPFGLEDFLMAGMDGQYL
ncbi:hypothetical protein QBC47DRAFT_295255 [Echria macrotheca]|uniref:Xylanolytic transcriptional activator regulatory domain-containing protein n=1 Tax=Echria macrotheca TaxID=438768 RepID=A0AAJ0BJX8_9PEZI|nr:hypothetical protein QBC47DRAFT_295255 [Echria macrotheca]